MGAAPDREDTRADHGCQVHIRAVHRDHSVHRSDENELVREVEPPSDGVDMRAVCSPLLYLSLLLATASEEEDLEALALLDEVERLLHQCRVVGLRPCRGEGGYAETQASWHRLSQLGVEPLEGRTEGGVDGHWRNGLGDAQPRRAEDLLIQAPHWR